MAKRAIFHRDFEYDHRPARGMTQIIKAGPEPKILPAEIIDAAIKAGAAVEYTKRKLKEQSDGASDDRTI